MPCAVGETRMAIDDETRSLHPALEAYEGREIVLGIRPEDLDDAALANGDQRPRLQGKVEMREALGSEVLVHFTIAAPQAVTDDVRELVEDVGDDRAVDQLAGRSGSGRGHARGSIQSPDACPRG